MGLNRRKTRKMKMKGGVGEEYGLPPCVKLTYFRITDDQINAFKTVVKSPMDCFINAPQILNIVNNVTADIMRISTAGKTGFTQEEIEKIFIILSGYNHDFKGTTNSNDFSIFIANNLPPGNVVFAGHEGQSKHVYLIGRNFNGTIVYIDPQRGTICDLSLKDCQDFISNNKIFRLMFHSEYKLTLEQLQILGFTV